MDIHSTLRFTHTNALTRYLEAHPDSAYADGGFSRVVWKAGPPDVTPGVYKLTSCPATMALFDVLYQNAAVPGMPRVRECFGLTAVDASGMPFKGYEVEALYPARSPEEYTLAHDLAGTVAALISEYTQQGACPRQASLATCRELARTNAQGLGAAFGALFPVLRRAQAVLDFAQPDNLLFTAAGELTLADPVALTYSRPALFSV